MTFIQDDGSVTASATNSTDKWFDDFRFIPVETTAPTDVIKEMPYRRNMMDWLNAMPIKRVRAVAVGDDVTLMLAQPGSEEAVLFIQLPLTKASALRLAQQLTDAAEGRFTRC